MLFIVLKFLHVLFAIIAVGFNAALRPADRPRQRRAGTDDRVMRFALRTVKVMDDYVANPCYVLLLITGVGMVHAAGYPWSLMWIHGSLALLVIIAVLGLRVLHADAPKADRGAREPRSLGSRVRASLHARRHSRRHPRAARRDDRRPDGVQTVIGSGAGVFQPAGVGDGSTGISGHHGVRRVGLGLTAGARAAGAQTPTAPQKRTFKLKYAPHIGMFENSAGKDPLDQIRFMADAGFRAFEDNGMMKRPVELQQQMGDLLAKRGMTMGVFVIDGGDNWKVSLTTGKPEFVDAFVKACRESVDVAKRVNAKWMTVVPGYFERQPADRHPVGPRHRCGSRGRRRARAARPGDGARAAERQSGSVPAHAGRRLRDLPRREQPGVQDPVRHVPRAAEPGAHDRAHRLGVGRDRLLPDRRHPGPQGAGHRRDELPEHLQAHRRRRRRRRRRTSCSAWSTATSCRAPTENASSSRPTSPPTASERRTMAG